MYLKYINTITDQKNPNYFRVAWQSALAAALGLGLPAGLLLWLILLQQRNPSALVDRSVTLLQANGWNKIVVLAVCSLIWSFLLGRISGYRPWWKIGLATVLGILVGWFSPLSNMDGWFSEKLPVHTLYAIAMCGIVASATLCVGLAYGLLLHNFKAALTLAITTGLASALTMLLAIIIFDQFGIRVGGTVPFAMSKVTLVGLLLSAITGGMVLGVGFSYLVKTNQPVASA